MYRCMIYYEIFRRELDEFGGFLPFFDINACCLIATSGDELTLGADAATRDVINIPSKYIQHYFTLYFCLFYQRS